MANVRLALTDDRDDVPLHFEGVPLRPWVRAMAWAGGVVAVPAGIALMVLAAGSGLEVIGAVAAAKGALLLFAVVRCRRFEVTVGRRWLKTACGPLLKQDLALQLAEGAQSRAAGGWRRLFADHEVATRLVSGEEVVMPSHEPEDLVQVVNERCAAWRSEG